MHERHLIFVNFMTFDKTDLGQRVAIKQIFRRLFEEAKSRGYSAYRSHVNFMGKTTKKISYWRKKEIFVNCVFRCRGQLLRL
jgi:hypothetical protein